MARDAICRNCRFFRQDTRAFYAAWCGSPGATTIDRVHGPLQPRLDGMIDPETVRATTNRCDKEGWFEAAPRSWWRFWL